MSDENSAKKLFFLEEVEPFKLMGKWMNGSSDGQLPLLIADGGINGIFEKQREVIDSLVQKLEEIFRKYAGPDPNFSPGSLFNETRVGPSQSNWRVRA